MVNIYLNTRHMSINNIFINFCKNYARKGFEFGLWFFDTGCVFYSTARYQRLAGQFGQTHGMILRTGHKHSLTST